MSSEEGKMVDGSINEDLKEAVKLKMIQAFEKDAEALVRILFYLDEEERVYSSASSENCPAWRNLLLLQKTCNDEAFVKFAKRLAEDTQRADRDPGFRETMSNIYNSLLPPSDDTEDLHASVDFSKVLSLGSSAKTSGLIGLAHAWTKIPPQTQLRIAQFVTSMATRNPMWTAADEAIGLVSKVEGSVVMVVLAVAQLSYDAIKNIHRWLTGEISGKRCCKNVIDATVTVAAGVGGGLAGAALGAPGGPVGIFVGGVVGSVASSIAADTLSDYLTQMIFGLPKEEALENAYRYFGLGMNPSTNEINSSYRRLCLKHHPDKGGSNADFHCVQIQLAIIRDKRNM